MRGFNGVDKERNLNTEQVEKSKLLLSEDTVEVLVKIH